MNIYGPSKDRLFSYLPNYYRDSKFMDNLLGAEGQEIDRIRNFILDFEKQLYVRTATWALDLYEDQHGLPIDHYADIEERRRAIISKKLGGRADGLLSILKLTEPRVYAGFGGCSIPFYLPKDDSFSDYEDYGKLIRLIEKWKPAAYPYSFTLVPPDRKSGYTIYPNHSKRDSISFAPESGSLRAGRWPTWNTIGTTSKTGLILSSKNIVGIGGVEKSGNLYSGHIIAPSTKGAVKRESIVASAAAITGIYKYVYSGVKVSGTIPTDTGIGSKEEVDLHASANELTGHKAPYYSGSTRSSSVSEMPTSNLSYGDRTRTTQRLSVRKTAGIRAPYFSGSMHSGEMEVA